MYKASRLLCLIGVIVLFMAGLANAKDESNQASLNETMDWIKSKVDGHAIYLENDKSTWEYQFEYNNCNITLVKKTINENLDEGYDKSEFNLKHIDQISMSKYREDIEIELRSNNKNVSVTYSSLHSKVYATFIHFNKNSDIPDRLLKAFNHAATLCGGGPEKANKKEPF